MNKTEYTEAVYGSLYNAGNNMRLHNALKKEKISIAFAGGSITKGWDGTKHLKENYTDFTLDYLRKKYPEKKFSGANLSTESANSFIGLSITDKVIEETAPDIVFIEYAVNNECGHDHIVSYESLVNRMLSLPSEPAVILVFLINRSLYTSQGYMKRIGMHYDLTSVSVADSMKSMLENGFEWSRYSDDSIHPNTWGHRFIADCIINALEGIIAGSADTEHKIPGALFSLDYADYRACVSFDDSVHSQGFEEIQCPEYGEYFNSGLKYKSGIANAAIKFDGEFKTLFAAYVHDRTERFSDADIIIDGEKRGVLQGKSIYGWGNINLKNVFSFDCKGKHSVELKVKDPKKDFILIEFGLS